MVTKNVVVLPKSKKEVEFKPIYLKDLFEMIKINTEKSGLLITSLLALAVKRVDEKSLGTPKNQYKGLC